jgi:hypothetical protein
VAQLRQTLPDAAPTRLMLNEDDPEVHRQLPDFKGLFFRP